jgi:hypothetical protein
MDPKYRTTVRLMLVVNWLGLFGEQFVSEEEAIYVRYNIPAVGWQN